MGTSVQAATTAPHHLSPGLVLPPGCKYLHCLCTIQHPDPSPTPILLNYFSHKVKGSKPQESSLLGTWAMMSHLSCPSTSMSWAATKEQEVALCNQNTSAGSFWRCKQRGSQHQERRMHQERVCAYTFMHRHTYI